MTIIDAIYTIIATKRGQQAVDQFRSIEKALESKKY
jgi:DNA-binding MurR/RpiR family transcriptional regulator